MQLLIFGILTATEPQREDIFLPASDPIKTNQLAHLRSLVSLRCPHEFLRQGRQIMRQVKILMTARMLRLICFFAWVHMSGSLRLSNFCKKAVAKDQSQELTLTYIFITHLSINLPFIIRVMVVVFELELTEGCVLSL